MLTRQATVEGESSGCGTLFAVFLKDERNNARDLQGGAVGFGGPISKAGRLGPDELYGTEVLWVCGAGGGESGCFDRRGGGSFVWVVGNWQSAFLPCVGR